MFKVLGVLVALYVVYAAIDGKVYTKSGPGGRTVFRQDSPEYFWVVILIYAGLGLALWVAF